MMGNIQKPLFLTIGLVFVMYVPVFAQDTSAVRAFEEKTTYAIVDTHEHIQDRNQAYKYNDAINSHNVKSIILVASPKEVLTIMDENEMGFTNAEWNNNEILALSKKDPGRFYAFATYSPEDTQIVAKLSAFIENGGTGLKLYNGHYVFYDLFKIRLDAPHLMPVYAYCEKNKIPIIFHANARYYWDELKNVLDAHPKLIVNLAHFCMSIIDLDRIAGIFNTYENVYSDISCGEGELCYETLTYLSRYAELYRGLIQTYKTRFLFGTDIVLTDDPKKDVAYVEGVFSCYRNMLEKQQYTGNIIHLYLEEKGIAETQENSILNGLHLDHDTLKHLYEINPARFLGIPYSSEKNNV